MRVLHLTVALVALATTYASCPGGCSGHGTCQEFDKCKCMPRWLGPDCASRQCPYGVSWVAAADNKNSPAGWGLEGQHDYTECSSKGICDRDSGECECFEGYQGRGCRRTTCPNGCSGHGRCQFNSEIMNDASYMKFNSQSWDKDMTRQCTCDRGFEGVDCSSKICPTGDDPLTECNNAVGSSRDDVQTIYMSDTAAVSGADGHISGFFTLTFQDMYNGIYTTRPIKITGPFTDQTAIDTQNVDLQSDVKNALEELPNFAIPNATVKVAYEAAPSRVAIIVWFVDSANSGEQHLLKVKYADSSADVNDDANMQPRFTALCNVVSSGTACDSFEVNVVHSKKYWDGTAFVAWANGDQYEEDVQCSNRGKCDTSSGKCDCFEGYTGEACAVQTVFF